MLNINNIDYKKYKSVVIIGDVHAKFDELNKLITDPDKLYIQLGDLGVGFPKCPWPEKFPDNFMFFPGNHDSPDVCKQHPNCMGYYGYIKALDIFFVGGAWSIDWEYRIPGVSWWDGEQMSGHELREMIEFYKEIRPGIMLSHDCPLQLYGPSFFNKHWIIPSRTATALDECFDSFQPTSNYFGHHHFSKSKKVKNTKFQCLNELETIEIKMSELLKHEQR